MVKRFFICSLIFCIVLWFVIFVSRSWAYYFINYVIRQFFVYPEYHNGGGGSTGGGGSGGKY